MNKAEFLAKLEETLQGEVPQRVSQDNLRYYDNYINQEVLAGQSEEQVIATIGDPRLIARTIIDSSEASGEIPEAGSYGSSGESYTGEGPRGGVQHNNSNGWIGKAVFIGIVLLILFLIVTVVGGIFSLLFRFAGPLIVLGMVFWFIKNMRR